jgi:hypothetical protein
MISTVDEKPTKYCGKTSKFRAKCTFLLAKKNGFGKMAKKSSTTSS